MNDLVALFDFPLAPKQLGQQRFFLLLSGFQLGQENASQIAHRCGVAKEILHEMFDRAPSGAVLVIHPAGDLDLHVK